VEHLAADPNLTDLWIQGVHNIRQVFSGRILCLSSWGEHGGYTFAHQPQLIGPLDVFGVGFFLAYIDHPDPSVSELAASYQKNSSGHNSLQTIRRSVVDSISLLPPAGPGGTEGAVFDGCD
jgi:hypothetical protein